MREVDAVVVQAPAAFGAEQRRARGHFRAVTDCAHLGGAHQFVWVVRLDLFDILSNGVKTLKPDFHLARHLRRLQIVVHHAAQLVFDLGRRQAALAQQRRKHARAFGGDLFVVHRRVLAAGHVVGRVLPGKPAVRECAEHVVVRDSRHVAGRVEPGHGRLRAGVHVHAGCAVAAAEADLGDVHLDHLAAVVGAAPGMETAAARPLVCMKDLLDGLDRFFREVVELQEHRAVAALQFLVELPHHLAAPVVAFDEAFALAVRGETAERAGDVRARGAVVVLDQRIDLEAFEIRERGTGVIRHRIAVARVGRILVGAHQVARGRQAEAAGRAAAENHGLRADHVELGGAAVEAEHTARATLRVGQHARRHDPVRDRDARALQLPVQHLLDVVSFRHREHVRAHVMDLLHRVVAGAVLLELHAPAIELLDRREAVRRICVHGLLVDDPVVGDRDLARVLLGRRMPGDHRVVQAVHPHRDRAAALHVCLFEQQHAQGRVALLRLDRRHRAGGAAADHDDVVFEHMGSHRCFLAGLRGFCRSMRSRYWKASPRK